MIRYYCDVCHEEITGWYNEIEAINVSLQATDRERNQKRRPLHFHQKCLALLFDAVEQKAGEDE